MSISTDLFGGDTQADAPSHLAEQALADDKRESLYLAVKTRWIALAIFAVMLPFINPRPEALYYEALLVGFALIGWGQRRIGRVGVSRSELTLLFCDLALMTIVCVAPNPFAADDMPLPMTYRFGAFPFFFVLLAGATLAYSWRTVLAVGTWTTGMWSFGLLMVWLFASGDPALTEAAQVAFGKDGRLADVLDPNNIQMELRIQEIIVFAVVAGILAVTVRRSNRLLLGHAAVERERANLARYFSPNVVAELSQNDEPLKQVRHQDVAVLFVDIVGFTALAGTLTPEQVIVTLRDFHGRMEHEVFRHHGTLDKYLGDGLMATFGTPAAGDADAHNGLACARAMAASVDTWNAERVAAGDPPLRASFGLHYGPVVLGDIGVNRLEFAVIGNTVNIASRLEALTRTFDATIVASDALITRVQQEPGDDGALFEGFTKKPEQTIRGVEHPLTLWVKS